MMLPVFAGFPLACLLLSCALWALWNRLSQVRICFWYSLLCPSAQDPLSLWHLLLLLAATLCLHGVCNLPLLSPRSPIHSSVLLPLLIFSSLLLISHSFPFDWSEPKNPESLCLSSQKSGVTPQLGVLLLQRSCFYLLPFFSMPFSERRDLVK